MLSWVLLSIFKGLFLILFKIRNYDFSDLAYDSDGEADFTKMDQGFCRRTFLSNYENFAFLQQEKKPATAVLTMTTKKNGLVTKNSKKLYQSLFRLVVLFDNLTNCPFYQSRVSIWR